MKRRIFCIFLCMIFLMLNISESVYAQEVADYVAEENIVQEYNFEYVLNSDWGNGFNALINISVNEKIDDWTLEFDYAREITEIWDATICSHEAEHYILKGKEYNTAIEAGQMITIGFNGNGGNEFDDITNVSLYSGDKRTGDDTDTDTGNEPDDGAGDNENNQNEVKICFNTSDYEEYAYEEENCYVVNKEITSISGTAFNADIIMQMNYKIYDCLENVLKQGNIDVREDWIIEEAGLAIGYNRIEIEVVTENESKIEKISLINTCAENMSRVQVDMEDSDGDGIPNYYEEILGFDKGRADTDGDGLTDYDEFLYTDTDPSKYDSDENGISDGDEDFDEDGLKNVEEVEYKIACYMIDTDGDGLSDYEEIRIYGTNPLVWDSDEDGIRDGLEIERGWNPLGEDSDGDGLLDGEKVLTQTITEEINEERQPGVKRVSVTFDCNGDIEEKVIIISTYNIDLQSSNVVGIVGTPIDVEVDTEFDEASISIEYDESMLGETAEENLRLMWYDEGNDIYVLLEDSYVDTDKNVVTYKTNHFSTYIVVDSKAWEEIWDTNSVKNKDLIEQVKTGNVQADTGSIYKCYEKGMTWQEAKSYCESQGGHLVTITSAREQQIVESLMRTEGSKNSYWIGAIKNSKTKCFDEWITGENFVYNNFKYGQPDTPTEDALMIYRNNNYKNVDCFGVWNDMFSSGERNNETFFGKNNFGFICEWDGVKLTDSDGDGLYDIYEIEGMQLPNGQIVYLDSTEKNSLIERFSDSEVMGYPSVVSLSNNSEFKECLIFHGKSSYGLSDEFIYVDGRVNKDGSVNNEKMNYIGYPTKFIWQKYEETKRLDFFNKFKTVNGEAGVHSSYMEMVVEWIINGDYLSLTKYLTARDLVGKVCPPTPFGDALHKFLYPQELSDRELMNPAFSASRREYIDIKGMMNNLFLNSMKQNYVCNVEKAKIAARGVLGVNNREIIIALNPSYAWTGSLYFKNFESIQEIIAASTNINAYGVFNDCMATGTFDISYSLIDKAYNMDINYYIVDYYNFDNLNIFEEMNALGISSGYEIYGVFKDEQKWKD